MFYPRQVLSDVRCIRLSFYRNLHRCPWWNPAVENQATDRAHRIGQTRHVFNYKLITRGTVEEKILALQQKKKELADLIIGGDDSVAKELTQEDLEFLFSF